MVDLMCCNKDELSKKVCSIKKDSRRFKKNV